MDWINIAFLFDTLHKIFVEFFFQKIVLGLLVVFITKLFDFSLVAGMEALLILVVFHFVISIFAAYRAGEKIESAKLVTSAVKVAVYGLLISSAYLTEVAIGTDVFFDQTVIAFLAVTEFAAILDAASRMGFAIPKRVLNKVNGYLQDESVLKAKEKKS